MSLGFNSIRRPHFTNLPGAVGANVVRRSPTRRASAPALPMAPPKAPTPRPAPPTPRPAPSPAKSAPPAESVAKAQTIAPPPPMQTLREDMAALYEESQWVYATARHGLEDEETGEALACAGERVMLVYPMRTDATTGRVSMRLKAVHPTTGALRHAWVAVYDPDAEDDAHRVNQFSLLA
jgi:hypothetical protein